MKGIALKQWEVQAIQDGRKSRLTRPVKFKYGNTHHKLKTDKYGTRLIEIQNDVEGETFGKNPDGTTWQKLLGYIEPKSPYKVGDILYVKETWMCNGYNSMDGNLNYSVKFKDESTVNFEFEDNERFESFGKYVFKDWNPSLFMPKEAARIFLRVKGCRVEHLQDMCVADCVNEGADTGISWTVDAKPNFIKLWDSTIKKSDIERFGWKANPWVWVIELERIGKEDAYELQTSM